jgi:tetratricopeptide (TPR) repeat protein
LATAVVLAIALSGCGGDDEREANPAAERSLESRIKAAEKQAKARPDDPKPLAALATAHFQQAGLKTSSIGAYTDEGKDDLSEATKVWDRYLALNPEPLDTDLAQMIAAAYGPGSLDLPKKAVDVQQLLTQNTPGPPRASQYAQLAQKAYYAGEIGTAKAAADRAIELSPERARKAMRRLLKTASQARPPKP